MAGAVWTICPFSCGIGVYKRTNWPYKGTTLMHFRGAGRHMPRDFAPLGLSLFFDIAGLAKRGTQKVSVKWIEPLTGECSRRRLYGRTVGRNHIGKRRNPKGVAMATQAGNEDRYQGIDNPLFRRRAGIGVRSNNHPKSSEVPDETAPVLSGRRLKRLPNKTGLRTS